MRFTMVLAGLLLLLCAPGRASAEVVVSFWSHARDQNYPHAFITMRGRVDATGEGVDSNIGFTAHNISPMVLLGSVRGEMQRLSPSYLARPTNRLHFQLTLDDAQYARLTALIERWRTQPQPAYNLNRRNCVHFVMEAAALLGLSVNRQSGFFRKPADFLMEVERLNPRLLASRR